jgi:hypothetical protein
LHFDRAEQTNDFQTTKLDPPPTVAGKADAVLPGSDPRSASLCGLQFADPDIAEAHGSAVILQGERQFLRVWRVGRARFVCRRASEFDIVLNQDSVVEHGYARGAKQLSLLVEARAVKNDVVALPLSGRA